MSLAVSIGTAPSAVEAAANGSTWGSAVGETIAFVLLMASECDVNG